MDGTEAPGRPGTAPTWTSGTKDLVTTALGDTRLWATFGHGIVNEVYWPSTGEPQIRDLGFLIAGPGWWREVKRRATYQVSLPTPATPLPTVVHEGADYQLTLEYLPDPVRDVLLIRFRLEGDGLVLCPLLAPHLGVIGWDNMAWVASTRELFAEREDRALCLAADGGFRRGSAGYVGVSDGWQDFSRNGRLTDTYDWAGPGNVALIGELAAPEGVLALGLAATARGAQVLARSSLATGFAAARTVFVDEWQTWASNLVPPGPPPGAPALPADVKDAMALSASVLRVHEDKTHPGAVVASLSIPWGNAGNDIGGYHLVWPRDAGETGLGLAAMGQREDAGRVLHYLAANQQDDGSWTQNFFPDGQPRWTGVQLDQVGFPVLLAAALAQLGVSPSPAVGDMVRRAVAYLAQHGPLTPQDRWEETAGGSPFTIGVEVAALVAGADFLPAADRDYALALADSWNERIEEWTYVVDGALDRRFGTAGHYVRIGPPPGRGGLRGWVELANQPQGTPAVPAEALMGMEFLYLVRLGLREPDHSRVRDTLRIAEELLGRDTPSGRAYYRYNQDGYGENADGSPYTGAGVGRPWPLLAGERGHYAVLAGEDATPQVGAMLAMRGRGGMIPEQIWDANPIPERDLFPGEPTGSAMPLVWAHAEFIKLVLTRERGQPAERLAAVWNRYQGRAPQASTWYWRTEIPIPVLPRDRALVIEDRRPFTLHVGRDGWQEVGDRPSEPLGLGMHGVRLDSTDLSASASIEFTRRYGDGIWEGRDWQVAIAGEPAPQLRLPRSLVDRLAAAGRPSPRRR